MAYLQLQEIADEWREALETLDEDNAELYDDDERTEARELCAQFEELALDLGVPQTPDGLESHDEQTFISEHDWEDYARQLAEDIGAIQGDAGWPIDYINWERAAEALKMDYSQVDYEGLTYYYR